MENIIENQFMINGNKETYKYAIIFGLICIAITSFLFVSYVRISQVYALYMFIPLWMRVMLPLIFGALLIMLICIVFLFVGFSYIDFVYSNR